MNPQIFVTGIGLCKEPLSDIDAIKPVKTVIMAEELAISAVSIALKQSGLSSLENCAVVFGVDDAIDNCKSEFFKGVLHDGAIGASPLLFPFTSPNAITAQVSIAFGIKGESITIASGPLSFFKSVEYAVELLRTGITKSAVVGGVSGDEAMAVILDTKYSGNGLVIDAVTSSGKPLLIDSINDSFAMMVNAVKKGGTINAADKNNSSAGFVIKYSIISRTAYRASEQSRPRRDEGEE